MYFGFHRLRYSDVIERWELHKTLNVPKRTFLDNYAHHPLIKIRLEIKEDVIVDLIGVIDTGSTYTVLSKTICSQYYKISDFNTVREIDTLDSKSIITSIKRMNVKMPNSTDGDKPFKIEIYTGKIPEDENYPIDIILGLTFLKECVSFWLDANNKTFKLEYFC